MKNILLTALFLSFLSLRAQDRQMLMQQNQDNYKAYYLMDFDGILNHMYPGVFELVPREKMYETLDANFQNEHLRIRLVTQNPEFTYGEFKKADNKTFCIITYHGAFRMMFERVLDPEDVTEITKNLETNMPDKKVTFEPRRNGFFIEGKETVIAISDEKTEGEWRFMNFEPNRPQLFEMVFGKEMKEKLGF